MEKADLANVGDCDVLRRDADAAMAYVQKKHGSKHPIHITLHEHSAMTLLPPEA